MAQFLRETLESLGPLDGRNPTCNQGKGNYLEHKIPPDSGLYNSIESAMQQTIREHRGNAGGKFNSYNLIEITRIGNQSLRDQYVSYREVVRQENSGNANERMLFHGTPKVNDIIKHGFDKSETNPKGMFGGGFYFADLSSKANQYVLEDMHCGDHNRQSCQAYLRKLLLCRVLLGNTEKRTQSESYDTAPPYHHSITAVPSDKGLRYKEYVVYKNKQIYPEVVITYKIKQ